MIDRRFLAALLVALFGACASGPASRPSAALTRLESFERMGLEAVEQDRWDRAVEYFGLALLWARSLDQRPAEARSELNLAWLEERSGKLDLAEVRLLSVLEGPYANDPRAEAALRLARLAGDGGRFSQARNQAALARSLSPAGHPRLHTLDVVDLRLDLQQGQQGRLQTLLPSLVKRIESPQDKAAALRLLAEVQLRGKAPAAALETLNAAFTLDVEGGRSARLAQNLALQARAYTLLQQPEVAQRLRKRADAVCQAWLRRFSSGSRWHPRDCGDLALLAAAPVPVSCGTAS